MGVFMLAYLFFVLYCIIWHMDGEKKGIGTQFIRHGYAFAVDHGTMLLTSFYIDLYWDSVVIVIVISSLALQIGA